MASWADIEADAPQFAARVRSLFDAGTNKTMATLRRDGSPRISATELQFEHGAVTLGMMPRSLKLVDVLRDPRVAIHSPTLEPDPAVGPGDAKLAGLLVPTSPAPGAIAGSYFELDIGEVVLTWVDMAEQVLVVESWHPGRGWEERRRT